MNKKTHQNCLKLQRDNQALMTDDIKVNCGNNILFKRLKSELPNFDIFVSYIMSIFNKKNLINNISIFLEYQHKYCALSYSLEQNLIYFKPINNQSINIFSSLLRKHFIFNNVSRSLIIPQTARHSTEDQKEFFFQTLKDTFVRATLN